MKTQLTTINATSKVLFAEYHQAFHGLADKIAINQEHIKECNKEIANILKSIDNVKTALSDNQISRIEELNKKIESYKKIIDDFKIEQAPKLATCEGFIGVFYDMSNKDFDAMSEKQEKDILRKIFEKIGVKAENDIISDLYNGLHGINLQSGKKVVQSEHATNRENKKKSYITKVTRYISDKLQDAGILPKFAYKYDK